ncbi:aldehyde dehydrogenase family protein [Mesorhizobium sp. XAP10]|uniref:aldehyde dehydrogenase family protein n=1 Tax=unclassified Mesorhizobium TaxID=325217 RepID=UPI0023DF4749|nr:MULTISPECIES: aldehyde dehydrogenase family protein [unclassified Mesorhizobium]MDF3154535.1 aldehyde dehydrogenase family protein [Mesorhizobium sp. XAP10]MDF3247915.1 aldehyde dehydrogenase family protein [Mesorhizobium sp. XAP4]
MNAIDTKYSSFGKFVSQPLKLHIGGEQVAASSGRTFDTLDPGTGSVIATLSAGDAADIDAAVGAARQAFNTSGWATMPPKDRAVILHRLADLIDQNTAVLAEIESKDVGKPRGQAEAFDIPHAAKTLRYYADLSVTTRQREPLAVSGNEAWSVRHPYGVCAFIFPWNFPFLLIGWGVSPALAAGNTIVIKPAEDTPLSALYFARLAEQAGVPAGVVNVVTGLGRTAGSALSAHPGINRISFTGSPEVGKLVAEAAARNLVPAKLELGGKGAAVLFDDIATKDAAEALASAVTLNAGQVCCTATRWLVHEKVADAFIEKAVSTMAGMKVGYGGDATTQIGPVVSEKQRQRVLGYVERSKNEGAEAYLPGGVADIPDHGGGFYVKPALLGGSPDNIIARDEVFGPVAYVMTFRDEEEAIALVNRSPYGLANSVWTADIDRAKRVAERLVAGNSWINAHNLFPHGVTYGGVNLSGTGGGVLGPDTLEDYYRKQSVVRPL